MKAEGPKGLLEAFSWGRFTTFSIVTFAHGFVGLAFFLQMGLLARILPVAEFGELAAAIAIATVAEAAINSRGSETSLAVFAGLAKDQGDRRRQLARQFFRIDLAWNLSLYALFAAAVAAADALRGTNSRVLLLLMIGGLVSFPWGTAKGYITVFLGPRAFAPIEIGYAATTLFGGVGLAYFHGAIGFAAGLVAASLVRSALALRTIRVTALSMFERDEVGSAIEHKTIWWFGLTGTFRAALVNLVLQADVLLLAAVSSSSAVGLYRAAKTVSSLTQRVSQPVWVVLKRPIISGTVVSGEDHSRRVVILAALGFAAAGLIVLPPLLPYGGALMALAFGEPYRASAELLWWLLPGAWLMYAVTGWSGLFGSLSPKRLTVLALYVVQLAVFAAATFALGATAISVAIALALSQLIASAGFWILFLRRSAKALEPSELPAQV